MSHNIMIGIANGEGFTEMSRNVTWDPFRRKVSSMEIYEPFCIFFIPTGWKLGKTNLLSRLFEWVP